MSNTPVNSNKNVSYAGQVKIKVFLRRLLFIVYFHIIPYKTVWGHRTEKDGTGWKALFNVYLFFFS